MKVLHVKNCYHYASISSFTPALALDGSVKIDSVDIRKCTGAPVDTVLIVTESKTA